MRPTVESIVPYMEKAKTYRIAKALYMNEGILDKEKLVSLVNAYEDKQKKEAEAKRAERTRTRQWRVTTVVALLVAAMIVVTAVVTVLQYLKPESERSGPALSERERGRSEQGDRTHGPETDHP